MLNLQEKKKKLTQQYRQLMEEAYNLRQSDSALSDIKEFRALKLLEELNRLKFLGREPHSNLN